MAYERIEQPCDFEVRTDGDNDNGGGFAAAASSYSTGTDRSQQAAAHVATGSAGVTATTMAGSGSSYRTKVVLSGYTVSSADVGNLVNLTCTDSDVFDGLYMIAGADSSANTWEFTEENRNSTTALNASGVSVTFKMGGGWADLGFWGSKNDIWWNDHWAINVWIRAGTYTYSTTSVNTEGGPFSAPSDNCLFKIEGYETTRGDSRSGGARPVIAAGSSGFTGTMMKIIWISVFHLELDGGGTATVGFEGDEYHTLVANCKVGNMDTSSGAGFYKRMTAVACEATGCYRGYYNAIQAVDSVAHDCTTGFESPRFPIRRCLAYDCTTGFALTSDGGAIYCTADDCSTAGFSGTDDRLRAIASVATNCGTGFNFTSGTNRGTLLYECAGYNNTTNYSSSLAVVEGFITPGADPWEDQSGRDYRLNSSATGGELLKGKGIGFTGQTAESDVNAFVTASSGGGSSVIPARPIQIGA